MDNLGETLESSKRWPLPRQSRQQKTVLRPRVGNQLADPDTELIPTSGQSQPDSVFCRIGSPVWCQMEDITI